MFLALACGGAQPAPAPVATELGTPMPELSVDTLRGDAWSPASARGSVLVVDVWASWCPPCREGVPRVDAIAARHPDARFVALSIDEDRAAMDAFLAEVPVVMPVLHDVRQQVLAAPLLITRVPTVLVIDRGGIIRHRVEEPSSADYEQLERVIAATLAAP